MFPLSAIPWCHGTRRGGAVPCGAIPSANYLVVARDGRQGNGADVQQVPTRRLRFELGDLTQRNSAQIAMFPPNLMVPSLWTRRSSMCPA